MTKHAIVLPLLYARAIAQSGTNHGTLDIKFSESEGLALVDGFRIGFDGGGRTATAAVTASWHALAHAERHDGAGLWYRVKPALHAYGLHAHIRSGAVSLDSFRENTLSGWRALSPFPTFALTCTDPEDLGEEVKVPEWAGWLLQRDTNVAMWCPVIEVADDFDLLEPLRDSWPLEELANEKVMLLGVGSIGSAIAEALASTGVRHLTLVDPDRLLPHNFVRHRVHPRHVGRHKVDAMRVRLLERDPALEVEALRLDVIYDTDQLRSLLPDHSIAVVALDGVEPRRAANHLIRRAGKPGVFACVLEDGAYGEILRFDPPRTACLWCSRNALKESGSIDPESVLDRGYGAGTRHLPMTAVPTDLNLVADTTAKVVLATLLERRGHRDQRLAGDHVIVGLRPKPNRAAPFDIEYAGEVRWHDLPPSRSDCPTCAQ